MRDKYGANDRAQKLKYHVQTSGRSLHAQEMDFNDIRTTLQALIALYDNCNSLHTNAYDEAVTTPSAESVRRALAIQLIINQEWGLSKNENPLQGSYIIDELTELVEAQCWPNSIASPNAAACSGRWRRISARADSGRVDALRTPQARRLVAHRRVNTFLNPNAGGTPADLELARGTEAEKQSQLRRLQDFQSRNAPGSAQALHNLQQAALAGENVFAVLDGRRSRLLTRSGHRGLLRGRRAIPPQRVTRSFPQKGRSER